MEEICARPGSERGRGHPSGRLRARPGGIPLCVSVESAAEKMSSLLSSSASEPLPAGTRPGAAGAAASFGCCGGEGPSPSRRRSRLSRSLTSSSSALAAALGPVAPGRRAAEGSAPSSPEVDAPSPTTAPPAVPSAAMPVPPGRPVGGSSSPMPTSSRHAASIKPRPPKAAWSSLLRRHERGRCRTRSATGGGRPASLCRPGSPGGRRDAAPPLAPPPMGFTAAAGPPTAPGQ